jgi:two-component system sensor histidine kinase CssS
MKLQLGQWPLAAKLWGAFAALTLLIFTLLAVLLPWTLKGFFTEQLYDILLDTQSGLRMEAAVQPAQTITLSAAVVNVAAADAEAPIPPYAPLPVTSQPVVAVQATEPMMGQTAIAEGAGYSIEAVSAAKGSALFAGVSAGPAIRHFAIMGSAEDPAAATAAKSSEPFMQAMEKDAFAQVLPVAKYTTSIDDKSIFYVIRKETLQGQPSFIVSYAWGNYRNDLVLTMFGRLMLLMVGLIVISWLPCLAIARYFTRPLVQMERHVGRMAERDWHEPIETGRKDEVGRLARAIETMRQRLVRQDRAQQFFLQHTSHELKTPVMVIRSYAQSIQDGVFPKGTLSDSIGVIMKEGERLEKRIRDLLLLNKLNYLTAKEKPFRTFELHMVIEDVVERLRYRRPEIGWELELPPTGMNGDQEQWKIALENMLDNQLRYASSRIRIQLTVTPPESGPHSDAAGKLSRLQISNDGPPLDPAITGSLFEPFRSGGDGQFGLGLAIVKQIMDHHGMTVHAANESDGVAFYIEPVAKAD